MFLGDVAPLEASECTDLTESFNPNETLEQLIETEARSWLLRPGYKPPGILSLGVRKDGKLLVENALLADLACRRGGSSFGWTSS